MPFSRADKPASTANLAKGDLESHPSQGSHPTRRAHYLAASSLIGAVAVLALALYGLAVDDAFITYRYGLNLAQGRGFVYNAGQAVLSTTAPLYGLVLALAAWLGLSVPAVSNLLSAVGIGAGSLALYALGRQRGRPFAGWLAGMLYALNPLLWLSLGMETAFQLALILAAFAANALGRPGAAGLALGAAFVTRFDAAVPAAIMFFQRVARDWRGAVRMAAAGVAAAAPVLIFLTLAFGSPLPATLLAKRAQNVLGVTGFYAGTTHLEGLVILLQGWFELTWLYGLIALFFAAGLVIMIVRDRWVIPFVFWGLIQFAAYVLIGSAPYFWYYAPLVPAAVWLIALGVQALVRASLRGGGLCRRSNPQDRPRNAPLGIASGKTGPRNDTPPRVSLRAVFAKQSPIKSAPGNIGDCFVAATAPRNDRYDEAAQNLTVPGVEALAGHTGIPSTEPAQASSPTESSCPDTRRPPGWATHNDTDWSLREVVLAGCLSVLALLPFAYSTFAIWQAQTGPLPDPTLNVSKVLPEAKVDVYRRVGEWIRANTPPRATLGATEVGVIGYYAEREMIDMLGLLQPKVALALEQGDPGWTLTAYQPDYLVLNAINPLYNLDPRLNDWFQAAYRPIQRFDDPRFWGSPVVAYRRMAPLVSLPEANSIPTLAAPVDALFGSSIRLLAVESLSDAVRPGESFAVRLWWRAAARVERDYATSVQLLGEQELVVAQRDARAGMGVHPTSVWQPGETVADLVLLGLPRLACAPDHTQLLIVLYDPVTGERLPVTDAAGRSLGDALRLGEVAVAAPVGDDRAHVSFARAVTLTGNSVSTRSIAAGESITLTQVWEKGEDWQEGLSLFVHLVSEETGKIIAQADGPPELDGQDVRTLQVPSSAAPGVYRLLVGVYSKRSGERLPWLDAVDQPLGDALPLCPVRVR